MKSEKNRRRIAWEAAKLLQSGSEKDWQRARLTAARRLYRGRIPAERLPDESAIRGALLSLAGELPSEAIKPPPQWSTLDHQPQSDRFVYFRSLLRPLETIILPRERHPEGDALYHSLQVFDLVRRDACYDEELLLAALLHEVGVAVDPLEPLAATLDLLDGEVTMRTRWLIENQSSLRALYDGSVSARRRRYLRHHPWYEDLVLFAEADRDGRQTGVPVPSEQEALDHIAGLQDAF